jgi:hypothetical protein
MGRKKEMKTTTYPNQYSDTVIADILESLDKIDNRHSQERSINDEVKYIRHLIKTRGKQLTEQTEEVMV